jgi:hypothetical protein
MTKDHNGPGDAVDYSQVAAKPDIDRAHLNKTFLTLRSFHPPTLVVPPSETTSPTPT